MSEHGQARLTRAAIVQTALRLVDQNGLDGLTMRRLAAELGVQNPALYWHFRNKRELLDEIADAIVQAPGMGPPRDGEAWPDWLTRRGRAYRRSLLAHRDGARIVANARLHPNTIRTFNQELAAMVDLGFTPVLALRTITAIAQYVNGFVLQEQSERQDHPTASPDQLTALAELLDGDTTAPLLLAIRDGGKPFGEHAFEHGLQALIDGIANQLESDHPNTKSRRTRSSRPSSRRRST